MDFKSHKSQLLGRILLLTLTLFYWCSLYYNDGSILMQIVVIGAVILEVYYLQKFLDKSNRELVGFLESIEWDDYSHSYSERTDSSLDELYEQFNKVMKKFRSIRAEKEAQHNYLKTIVHHVGIGIITFEPNGEVQIINSTAKKLLSVRHLKNIHMLKGANELLIDKLLNLRTGGRELIKITRSEEEEVQLSVYAIELVMQGKEFKLISLQNIQSELEEKEMEAWQNLIRVLTHEIMNSVTPISSLAGTMESDMAKWLDEGRNVNNITNETIEDFHTALHTIHRRSDSLIRFVSDFRNMTHIHLPNLEDVKVADLIAHVCQLLKPDIEEGKIKVKRDIPANLEINIDPQQIEQVIINLVKNAIQALNENEEDNREKYLTIKAAERSDGGTIITFTDNGPGIEEEALKKIFIPFFTTKKHGSGIGLSLSKQIMRYHQGTISVKSVVNEGTEFTLKFAG